MSYFFFFVWMYLLFALGKLINACYLLPLRTFQKLQKNGFGGPSPSFPMGNLGDMKKMLAKTKSCPPPSLSSNQLISHDIHASSLPYFSQWQKLHGKVFVYWLGVEPFLYVADPEFLKQMSGCVVAKNWGKPSVFKRDRIPLFGEYGLTMIEGNAWVRHRHISTPAFSSANLKAMANSMVESTTKMVDHWTTLLENCNQIELDMEKEMSLLGGEMIGKTSFGIDSDTGNILFDKIRAMQNSLFSAPYVGVPFRQYLAFGKTLESKKLGREVDDILLSFINERIKVIGLKPQQDLLGLLLEGDNNIDGQVVRKLTTRELLDECKTFIFGGYETMALAAAWTLMLLAAHPKWQDVLREEIKEVMGDKEHIDFTMLVGMEKMGWVMNEVLRLYPSSPNAQRQARDDIQVGGVVIPNGTNIWIDVVGMHHDGALWGDDVNEFKPERFAGDLYGGCKHKMGYLPFGFGGRMCIGRNYPIMEFKVVMSSLLRRFSFSLSPSYIHSPTYFFSFRPASGVPLIVRPI